MIQCLISQAMHALLSIGLLPCSEGQKHYPGPAAASCCPPSLQWQSSMHDCVQGLLLRFSQHRDVWGAAVEAMAQLDALASLAAAATDASVNGPVCRPEFLASSSTSKEAPAVSAHSVLQAYADCVSGLCMVQRLLATLWGVIAACCFGRMQNSARCAALLESISAQGYSCGTQRCLAVIGHGRHHDLCILAVPCSALPDSSGTEM